MTKGTLPIVLILSTPLFLPLIAGLVMLWEKRR